MDRRVPAIGAFVCFYGLSSLGSSLDRASTDTFSQLPHAMQIRHPDLPPRPERYSSDVHAAKTWLDGLRAAWLGEKDPDLRIEMGKILWDDAASHFLHNYQHEVTAGKAFHLAEIQDNTTTSKIALKSLIKLPELSGLQSARRQLRFREVGPKHIEAWTTSTGYLFHVDGKLVKKAQIKREDGTGREWFGSFIKNGSYCTTDIWNHDRQIHLFSKSDRWFKSIPTSCTVAWARASKEGNEWIVRAFSSAMCDETFLRVEAKGTTHSLVEPLGHHVDWRDVGPIRRQFWIERVLPSDDGSYYLKRHSPGHGMGSIYGTYEKYPITNWAGAVPLPESEGAVPMLPTEQNCFEWRVVIVEGNDYGFFPDSHAWWVNVASGFTWILKPDGTALGWVNGKTLGSADSDCCILVVSSEQTVLSVTEEGDVRTKRTFLLGKEVAQAQWLKDDSNIGFFEVEGQLHLAKW